VRPHRRAARRLRIAQLATEDEERFAVDDQLRRLPTLFEPGNVLRRGGNGGEQADEESERAEHAALVLHSAAE
jgi:hypothetical protein